MCGRYVSTTTPHRLAEIFQADAGELDWHPRYNLAPSAPALVVDSHGAGRTVTQCRWGLIPHWSREDLGARLSNARGETVWEKPSFRDAARGHRVIVPMDAFYEWAPAAPDGPRTRRTTRQATPPVLEAGWGSAECRRYRIGMDPRRDADRDLRRRHDSSQSHDVTDT